MKKFVPALLLLAACGGGGTPTASPSPTTPAPVVTSPTVETAKSVFCGHVSAHVNTLLNIIANPATEDDFGIAQMQDQIDEFQEDVKQTEDPEVARLAQDFISALQTLIDATETDGLESAVQQHGEAFFDAIANATTFCG
jgi:hypothetical protein